MENVVRNQILESPSQLNVPASGNVPISMCLDNSFSIDLEMRNSHVMYRMASQVDSSLIMVQKNGTRRVGQCLVSQLLRVRLVIY